MRSLLLFLKTQHCTFPWKIVKLFIILVQAENLQMFKERQVKSSQVHQNNLYMIFQPVVLYTNGFSAALPMKRNFSFINQQSKEKLLKGEAASRKYDLRALCEVDEI